MDAPDDVARVAYLAKAKVVHPDKCRDDPDATVKFQQLQNAYEEHVSRNQARRNGRRH